MPVRGWSLVLGLALMTGSLLTSGCAFGPRAIEHTHGRYQTAVLRVDEEQFLRNIVRLRYTEAPLSLDITSIAAQYELSGTAEARPFFSSEGVNGPFYRSFSAILPFLGVGVANRPTVSMIPKDDGSTVRQFLTPISTDTLVFLCQAGWPVSSILRIWVDRMNGVPNWLPGSGPPREAPPDFERFRRASELMQVAQNRELLSVHTEERVSELSGPLEQASVTAAAVVDAAKSGFEYRQQAGGKAWVLIKRERRLVLEVNPAGQGSREVTELATLLNLQPGLPRYEVVVGARLPDPAKNPGEPTATLTVTPRSIAQALFFLANGVEVPPAHLACGVVRTPEGVDTGEATRGFFRVQVCPKTCLDGPPAHAYVAVCYRDHWYYIDDRDQESKATLLLMLQLVQLDFKRQEIGMIPALTLPVGR